MSANIPSGYKMYSLPGLAPENKQIYDMLKGVTSRGQGGFDLLSRLAAGDTEAFEAQEKPAMRQLQQQILPEIAQRYGAQGMGRSSGFQNMATAAGTELAEKLQADRLGIQRNALKDLLGISELLLKTPTEQYGLTQKAPSFWERLLSATGAVGQEFAGQVTGAGARRLVGA